LTAAGPRGGIPCTMECGRRSGDGEEIAASLVDWLAGVETVLVVPDVVCRVAGGGDGSFGGGSPPAFCAGEECDVGRSARELSGDDEICGGQILLGEGAWGR